MRDFIIVVSMLIPWVVFAVSILFDENKRAKDIANTIREDLK